VRRTYSGKRTCFCPIKMILVVLDELIDFIAIYKVAEILSLMFPLRSQVLL